MNIFQIFIITFSIFAVDSILYDYTDKVVILNGDNIFEKMFNSSNLWLVQFYLDWCQHCKEFAPVYKALARDIADWSWVVKLGAIDCGAATPTGDENYLTCHQHPFWVLDYPELQFFHWNSNSSQRKTVIEAGMRVRKVRESILDLIEDSMTHLQWYHDTPKPNFSPLNASFFETFPPNVSSYKVAYLALVLEKESSTMGKEIILDMSSCSNITVRRLIANSSHNALFSKLKFTGELPHVAVVFSNGTLSPIFVSLKTRYFYVYQLQRLPGVGVAQAALESLRFPVSKQTNAIYRPVNRNLVYLADIESGIRYMLTLEVSAHQTITGAKLKSLQKIVALFSKVGSYFPGRNSTLAFFRALDNWIQTRSTFSSGDWLKKIQEKRVNCGLPATSRQWVECQSTSALPRGYPCSLWLVFHALTVAANRANVDKESVIAAFQSYIKEFFGCRECRLNFQTEIRRTPFKRTENDYDTILWMWKIHNHINKRLLTAEISSNSSSKVQFPPPDLCSRCRDPESGNYIEEEVARFLMARFSFENISWDYLDLRGTSEGWENQQKNPDVRKNMKAGYRFHPRGLGWNDDLNFDAFSFTCDFDASDLACTALVILACLCVVLFTFSVKFKILKVKSIKQRKYIQ